MIPKVPQTNLFHVELRSLSDQVAGYWRLLVEHKWYAIVGAAAVVLLFFWLFRGNRQ